MTSGTPSGRRESLIHGEPFGPRQLEYLHVHGGAAGQSVHVRPLTLGKAGGLFKVKVVPFGNKCRRYLSEKVKPFSTTSFMYETILKTCFRKACYRRSSQYALSMISSTSSTVGCTVLVAKVGSVMAIAAKAGMSAALKPTSRKVGILAARTSP